ncbi:winged helix-turn-helix domain-containing protein [Streptomyces sp. NRRL F-5123]|uniref:ArsR/SmtB family transcription factor n=1 Tax=Streptomyces sp. NRRL F-5123 TaxID=1463856 RepID=UPI0004E1D68F
MPTVAPVTEKPAAEEPPTGEVPADDVRPLDPRSLRGLAHPLRVRLLGALREFGPSTASALAGRLGESSGATSYHLRQLAAYGFVVDDPGRGTGRERWWRAAHRGTRVDSITEFARHPDPEVRGAINTLLYAQAAAHAEELGTWLGTMGEWPERWQEAFDVSDFTLRLTPELARELGDRLHELVDSYRRRLSETEAEAKDAARIRVHLHAFPRRTD